jgi:hypothetical protein
LVACTWSRWQYTKIQFQGTANVNLLS